ncbi:MAG: hypothetical protein LQ351_005276 [Letrouitia transgressa]|nr:MAG: hypothetical protein LQ351_005276 [Letrouitia transgressa]
MAEFIGLGFPYGTLHEISSENSTVALEKVQSFGTEGRCPDDELPPSDDIYDFIVFRGSDVKDLRIEEPPKENKPPKPPRMPDDPAILGSARRPPSTSTTTSPNQFNQQPGGQYQRVDTHPNNQDAFRPPQQQRYSQQPPYPYYPYLPNQRFGPQGFPGGPGFPGMGYGGPPHGWYPPPGQGFPQQQGQIYSPQMPIGSGSQYQNPQTQQHDQGGPDSVIDNRNQLPDSRRHSPEKQTATVKLPSGSTTPAPAAVPMNGPPPPTESKPDVKAALAPPASVQDAFVASGDQSIAAAQKNGRIMPAVPRVSPAMKPAAPVNGALNSSSGNVAPPGQPATKPPSRPAQIATKSLEDANRDARAAVAAAMAKLPPAPGQQKKIPVTENAVDNLTNKVNEMRTNDSIRTSKQPGTGGYAAGHRGRGGYRGGRPHADSATRKVEVPITDYDFASANAKFNKQDLVKEAIASGSPLGSPLDGSNDTLASSANANGDARKNSEVGATTTPVVGYNKSSFFDNISSESKEREEGGGKRMGGREFRNEEVKKNLETFGQGSVDGGFRGRGRGRGYGGRGGYGGPRGRGYGGRGRGGRGRGGIIAES